MVRENSFYILFMKHYSQLPDIHSDSYSKSTQYIYSTTHGVISKKHRGHFWQKVDDQTARVQANDVPWTEFFRRRTVGHVSG